VFPGSKGGRCVGLRTLPPSCAVVMKSGNLKFLEPSGPLQACNGTALTFYSVILMEVLLYYVVFVPTVLSRNVTICIKLPLNFTIVLPCIVTNFSIIKPTRCTKFTNLFWHETVHVWDSSCVHHREFIHCTLSNGICHTGL